VDSAVREELTDWIASHSMETSAAVLGLLSILYLTYRIGRAVGFRRRDKLARKGSRASLAGKTAEQWAPYLDGFPGAVNEARFLGAPIDYIVFRGLADGEVSEVVFVEVKSGRGKLSRAERSLRDCVRDKRVSWAEHRVESPAGDG
jgi:predicted Holliday junction resolvase-like endonuclease